MEEWNKKCSVFLFDHRGVDVWWWGDRWKIIMWVVWGVTKPCEVVLFKFQNIFLIKFFVQETFWLTSCGWAGTGDERDISNISFMGWKELPISVNVVRLEEKANWMVATKEGWLRMPENACLQLNMRISLLINWNHHIGYIGLANTVWPTGL